MCARLAARGHASFETVLGLASHHHPTSYWDIIGIVSREISEEFGGGKIAEASQSGAIVIGDKGVEIGVTFGVIAEPAVVSGPVWRHAVEMVTQAAVKALDHTVGLRVKWAGEAMGNPTLGADAIEGVLAGCVLA